MVVLPWFQEYFACLFPYLEFFRSRQESPKDDRQQCAQSHSVSSRHRHDSRRCVGAGRWWLDWSVAGCEKVAGRKRQPPVWTSLPPAYARHELLSSLSIIFKAFPFELQASANSVGLSSDCRTARRKNEETEEKAK